MGYMDMVYAKVDGLFNETEDIGELQDKIKKLVATEVVKSFKNGIKVKHTPSKANQEPAGENQA